MDQENNQKTEKRKKEIQNEIVKQTMGYIVAAFSLVAGLAWNDAISALINKLYPVKETNTVIAKFIYAVVITIIIVIVSINLLKLQKKGDKEPNINNDNIS
jgi:uncharacterized BrkB/YihY/UPF0761 family membrane protein